jgi:2-polyprenyl-3-methyl-5-hydroxy-6-metoxy-1,4-benzoquinol methylase
MLRLPDMRRRIEAVELMEAPDGEEALLFRTLDQFALINGLFSRYRTILRRFALEDMQAQRGRELHLVDVGAGALDISRWLLREATALGVSLRITGIDHDPRVLRYARERGLLNARLDLVCGDAVDALAGLGEVDYVFCNHVLHHLDDEGRVEFVRLVARTVRRRFVVCDLLRSRWSYVGFWLFGKVFLRSRSYAFPDGLMSVQRGFLPGELREVVHRAAVPQPVEIQRFFPGRLVMTGGASSSV